MAASESRTCMDRPDEGGISALRFRAGRQHILETASGLLSSTPSVRYLMSFFVRMRYCPDTDTCQVVIQPHYSTDDEQDEDIRNDVIVPLAREIRASIGGKISRRTCTYIAATSAMDADSLADLFILYFFAGEDEGRAGGHIWGVYQMNLAFRTFAPEMEEIAVLALERCLATIRSG